MHVLLFLIQDGSASKNLQDCNELLNDEIFNLQLNCFSDYNAHVSEQFLGNQ